MTEISINDITEKLYFVKPNHKRSANGVWNRFASNGHLVTDVLEFNRHFHWKQLRFSCFAIIIILFLSPKTKTNKRMKVIRSIRTCIFIKANLKWKTESKHHRSRLIWCHSFAWRSLHTQLVVTYTIVIIGRHSDKSFGKPIQYGTGLGTNVVRVVNRKRE